MLRLACDEHEKILRRLQHVRAIKEKKKNCFVTSSKVQPIGKRDDRLFPLEKKFVFFFSFIYDLLFVVVFVFNANKSKTHTHTYNQSKYCITLHCIVFYSRPSWTSQIISREIVTHSKFTLLSLRLVEKNNSNNINNMHRINVIYL